jgi:hypothetical protein
MSLCYFPAECIEKILTPLLDSDGLTLYQSRAVAKRWRDIIDKIVHRKA